ncbi:hypothetical protein [Chitinimonas sp. BJB300]|uniref:hypothetical protein n=1 Tax=Chitinimonas sp. BJB300 TaxID=1559339 RepID=UPI0011129A15|nr:hypothetical protein [Chitinimonas sp. BJB300]TSJ82539.1 hypothetical protein FG002_022170 [Chitinimonas sp. BJB300]
MSYTKRWRIYFSLGVIGLVFCFYFLSLLSKANWADKDLLGIFLYYGVVIGLLLASIVNIYTAYGFKFGRLDKVVGNKNSAVLIRSGEKIRENVSISFARYPDADNASLTPDKQCVLFVADWRPWVCSTQDFLNNNSR